MPRVPDSLDHSKIDFHRYYLYATLLNVPPILLTYPFRTVRLLQQSKTLSPVSTSVSRVAHDVCRTKGFKSLFAGSAIFTTGLTATKILQFATYDYAAQKIREKRYFGSSTLRNPNILSGILGTFSAIVTTFFIVPFNMVSQQLTIAKAGSLPNASDIPLYVTDSTEPLERPRPMTISESLRAQFKQEGFRFLFRGYCATLLSTGPFFAAYFPAYEVSRYWVKDGIDYIRAMQAARWAKSDPLPPRKYHQFLISTVAGSIASLAGVLASSPCDIIKTRIQTEQRLQPTNASGIKLPLPSLKWMDVFREILKKEGSMAFFSGARARVLLAIPGGAFNFIVFDFVRSKSLIKDIPKPMQAEQREMLETLYMLDRQFKSISDVEQLPPSVLLQTSLSPDEDVAEDHMFAPHMMAESVETKPSVTPQRARDNWDEGPEQLPPILLQQEN
ncbi:hypothetical protein BG011_008184 [Mortierella polycephala]|uniref:Mitochondrial carrier n=1 Tax=Mortierella polycephala TaxID=41804 RepID=A0A9P6PR20_9FUNG|nr:hypothetical protein BG011_008184 [Mortierella polycephala]